MLEFIHMQDEMRGTAEQGMKEVMFSGEGGYSEGCERSGSGPKIFMIL